MDMGDHLRHDTANGAAWCSQPGIKLVVQNQGRRTKVLRQKRGPARGEQAIDPEIAREVNGGNDRDAAGIVTKANLEDRPSPGKERDLRESLRLVFGLPEAVTGRV